MKSNATAIALLGRAGDIISFLPIARHVYNESGDSPHFVVNMNYLPILKGVSYVKPDPVHYPAARIDLAMQYAQTRYSHVINGQPYGKYGRIFDTGGLCDRLSFNQVAWEHNGYGEKFFDVDGFPLVFDQRDAEREAFLVQQHRRGTLPLVLLAVSCSRSSPFATHHVFTEAIKRKHGHLCEIVDLCQIKAARLYDVLGLFERARLLITGDNSFLHLATAIPAMRVIALTNDRQFLATTPRRHVDLKLRYAEVANRMQEVHSCVRGAITRSDSTRSLDLVSGVVVPVQSCRHHPVD